MTDDTPVLRADALDEEDIGNGNAANEAKPATKAKKADTVEAEPTRLVPVVVDGVFHGMREE